MENSKIRESLFHYQTRYPYKEFAGLRNSCCKISLMALVQSQTVKTALLSFGVTKLCDSRTLERRFDRNFCIKNPSPWKKIRSKLLELHDFVTTRDRVHFIEVIRAAIFVLANEEGAKHSG